MEHVRLLPGGGSTQIRGSATTDRDTRDPHRRYRCAITASLCASSGARARRAAGRVQIGQGPEGCEVVQAGETAEEEAGVAGTSESGRAACRERVCQYV